MKKYVALVLALFMMAMSFAACGKKTAEEAANPNGIQYETQVQEAAQTTTQTTTKPSTKTTTKATTKPAPQPTTKKAMTVDDLNKKFGCKMCHPGVMGVTSEYCTTSGNIAEYNFHLNGYSYCWRYAKSTGDISGIKTSEGTAYSKVSKDTKYVSADGWKLYRWFDGNGGQYVFMVEDQGRMAEDQFIGIAQEMESMTK